MKTVVVVAVAVGTASAENRYQSVGTGVGVAAGWRTWDSADGPVARATFGLTRALDAVFAGP